MRYVVTRTFLALGFVYELYENGSYTKISSYSCRHCRTVQ